MSLRLQGRQCSSRCGTLRGVATPWRPWAVHDREQNPLTTARGPARGAFFSVSGVIFSGWRLGNEDAFRHVVVKHYLACPINESCRDAPAKVFRPQSRNTGLSQFQTLAAAAVWWTQRNLYQRLPEALKGLSCWELWGEDQKLHARGYWRLPSE